MKIREYIRLRKQNDMVKISLIFLLIGIGFLVTTVWNGVQFVQGTNERTEYILSMTGDTTKDELSKLLEIENIESVSRTLEETVNIKYKNRESVITCKAVAKDYLEDLLGLDCSSNVKTFYMNQAAFHQLNQELCLYEEYGILDGSGRYMVEKGTVMSMRYAADEKENETYKSAEFVLVEDTIYGDEPMVWTCTDDVVLAREAAMIRILLERKPIDSTFRKQLENMGFSIESAERMVEWEAEIEIRMLKVEYGVLITVICVIGGILMLRRERIEYQ